MALKSGPVSLDCREGAGVRTPLLSACPPGVQKPAVGWAVQTLRGAKGGGSARRQGGPQPAVLSACSSLAFREQTAYLTVPAPG